MILLVIKATISGVLIAIISEVSKKSPGLGALIASIPLISIFAMVWMWLESKNVNKIADHAEATFWLVLPTLPMFLIIPFLLRANWNIWWVFIISIVVTIILYLVTIKVFSLVSIRI